MYYYMALKVGIKGNDFLESSPRIISFLFDCESNFYQNIIFSTFEAMYGKKEDNDVIIAEDLSFFA